MAAGPVRKYNPALYQGSQPIYVNPTSTIGGRIVHFPTFDSLRQSVTHGLRLDTVSVPQVAATWLSSLSTLAQSRTPDGAIHGIGQGGRAALGGAARALAGVRGAGFSGRSGGGRGGGGRR